MSAQCRYFSTYCARVLFLGMRCDWLTHLVEYRCRCVAATISAYNGRMGRHFSSKNAPSPGAICILICMVPGAISNGISIGSTVFAELAIIFPVAKFCTQEKYILVYFSCVQNLATGDMIAGVESENGACDPDHVNVRGDLSSES